MIKKRLRLTYQTRAMNLEGDLVGAIFSNGKWFVDFKNKLRALGFTVEQVKPTVIDREKQALENIPDFGDKPPPRSRK